MQSKTPNPALAREPAMSDHTRRPLSRGGAFAAIMLVAALATVSVAAAAVPQPAWAGFWDGDATPQWTNYANGPGNGDDGAVDVALAAGGVTYVAGTWTNANGNADITLTKYLAGDAVWSATKTYDGAAHANDWGEAMALGPGGVVYVTGSSTNASGKLDLVLVKWSGTSGKRLWVRRYDGPKHLADAGTAIGVDRRGNVTVAGYSQSGNGEDVFVRSWSPSGVVRWTWRYDGAAHGDDRARDLIVARDGSVYVNASIRGPGGVMMSLTSRRSRTGAKMWVDRYLDPETSACVMQAMAARPGGGVIVGGYQITTTFANDALVLGYDARGARVYIAHDGGADDQSFNDVAVTTTGHVVGVGYTVVGGDYQPRYVRFDASGNPASSATMFTFGFDEFTAVAADGFGGFAFCGTSMNAAGDTRIVTRRLSSVTNGGVWLSDMLPFPTIASRPEAIAVRGGTVAVVGAVDTGGAELQNQFLFTYVY